MTQSLASVCRVKVLLKSGHASTGCAMSLAFIHQTPSGVHIHLLPLSSKSFRGLTIVKKSGTIRRYHDATPRCCRSSLTVQGCSSSAMMATFSGSIPIPSLGTRCPKSAVFKHFSKLRLRFASFRRRNTSLRFCVLLVWHFGVYYFVENPLKCCRRRVEPRQHYPSLPGTVKTVYCLPIHPSGPSGWCTALTLVGPR